MIHINLSTIFYTHIEHSPTETIYIKYYNYGNTHTHARAHTHTLTVAETGYDTSWGGNTVRRRRFSVWL